MASSTEFEETLNESQESSRGPSQILTADDPFPLLEQDYNKMVIELENNPDMAEHLKAYRSLFDYTFNIREKSLNTLKTNAELTDKLDIVKDQLGHTMEALKTNESLISALENQVDIHHSLVDEAHTREQALHETLDNIRRTTSALRAEDRDLEQIKQDAKHAPTTSIIRTHMDRKHRECEHLLNVITKLKLKLNRTLEQQDITERVADEKDASVVEIVAKLEELYITYGRYKRLQGERKDRLEFLIQDLERFEDVRYGLSESVKNGKRKVLCLDKETATTATKAVECKQTIDLAARNYYNLLTECDEAMARVKVLKADNERILFSLEQDRIAEEKMKTDMKQVNKGKKAVEKRFRKYSQNTKEVKKEIKILRADIQNMDLTGEKLNVTKCKRKILDLVRFRERTINDMHKQKAIVEKYLEKITTYQQMEKKLSTDIENHLEEQYDQSKYIRYLQHECDRVKGQLAEMRFKAENLNDNLSEAYEIVQKQQDALNQQKTSWYRLLHAFDKQCTKKVTISKLLIKSNEKQTKLKEKLEGIEAHNAFLMDYLAEQENTASRQKISRKCLRVTTDKLIARLASIKKQVPELKAELAEKGRERVELFLNIDLAGKQIRQYDAIIQSRLVERDHTDDQVERRDDRLRLLYAELSILIRCLQVGDGHYKKRIADVQLLKLEIRNLRNKKLFAMMNMAAVVNLKSEVLMLDKNLSRERLKYQTLTEELSKPINVHYWRQIETRNPEAFELMKYITVLQKMFVWRAVSIEEKKLQLREIKSLYQHKRKQTRNAIVPKDDFGQQMIAKQKLLDESRELTKRLLNKLQALEGEGAKNEQELRRIMSELHELRIEVNAKKRRRVFKK